MTVLDIKAIDGRYGVNECRGERTRYRIDNNLVPEHRSLNRHSISKGIGIREIPIWRSVEIDGGCPDSINDSNRTVIDHLFIHRVIEERKQCRRLT